jgi:hypothetical protein
MERVFHKAKNFKEAEEWDILQVLGMKPVERQRIAKILRIQFYGDNAPDVREAHKKNDPRLSVKKRQQIYQRVFVRPKDRKWKKQGEF